MMVCGSYRCGLAHISQAPLIFIPPHGVYSDWRHTIYLQNHNLPKFKQLHYKWCEFKQAASSVFCRLVGRSDPRIDIIIGGDLVDVKLN